MIPTPETLVLNAHEGLVWKMAKAFSGKGVPFEDLLASGRIGVIRASRRFDPSRGTKVSSFVYFYVKAEIIDALRKWGRGAPPGIEDLPFEGVPETPSRDLEKVEIRASLEGLSQGSRALLRARFWEGLPITVIAKAQGRSRQATHKAFMRALREVKGRIEGEYA